MGKKKKLNKELKLDTANGFRLSLGTVNRENPTVVYVTGKAWAVPPELDNARYAVDCIKRCLRTSVRTEFARAPELDTNYIIEFDLKADSIIPKRRKFISFELLFKQREPQDIRYLSGFFQERLDKITERLHDKLNDFEFVVEKARK